MKILPLLNEKCNQSSLLSNSRLVFEFNSYEIVVDIEFADKSFQYNEFHVNLAHTDFKDKFAKIISSGLQINDVFIASSEYLGHREDIIEFKKPISICNRLYRAIDIIAQYDRNIIDKYILNQNEGYNEDVESALFCNLSPNYIFEIHVKKESYGDLNFFQFIINHLQFDDADYLPPTFYWPFYKKNQKIDDSKKIVILNTNTKARRLGYFKILSDFFKINKNISENFIYKKFERFSQDYRNDLKGYKNDKGLIKVTKTGVSAEPYITIAKYLGLINLINGVYTIGKYFKVYQVLKDEIDYESVSVFNLSTLDKLFFLELILQKDFTYITLTLELIRLHKVINYHELNRIFQPHLLARLDELLINLQYEQNSKRYRELKKVLERVKNWSAAEVYLEHVIMPRLNWFYDLGLVEIDQNLNITLTTQGITLFQEICNWNDINWERVISPDEFLNLFWVHTFDHTYNHKSNKNHPKDIKENEIFPLIIQYIDQSFEHFKTLAPNRVTASQAITYTKYKLYSIDQIKVGHRYISNLLENKKQNNFIYKYQKQYGDGYIQRRRSN